MGNSNQSITWAPLQIVTINTATDIAMLVNYFLWSCDNTKLTENYQPPQAINFPQLTQRIDLLTNKTH